MALATMVLLVDGSIPVAADLNGNWSALNTATIPVAQGGTNITTYVVGDLIYASAATTLATLAAVATGNALISGGVTTAPSWGKIAMGTHMSGTMAAAQFPALTGDITTVEGALATTLVNTGPGATGPIGSATVAPVITIDAKGRVTALTSATITAGVAVGESPTWTGQHTFTAAGTGPKIRLTDADSQIFIGGSTDPGWDVGAIHLQVSAGRGGAFYQPSSAETYLTQNSYYSAGHKYTTANPTSAVVHDSGNILLRTAASGTADTAITWVTALTLTNAGGIQIGAPTGGDKGAGTLNATAVYDDNVLLTDWAFDLYYDGHAQPDDPAYRGQQLAPFAETARVTMTERRLPWMPTRADFEAQRGLGSMVSRLWFGQEQQQMYLFDFDARLRALESRG